MRRHTPSTTRTRFSTTPRSRRLITAMSISSKRSFPSRTSAASRYSPGAKMFGAKPSPSITTRSANGICMAGRQARFASTIPTCIASGLICTRTLPAPMTSTASCGVRSGYGAFGNAIESVHNPNGNDPGRVTCFCTFCQAKAKSRGINVDRAFEGFRTLEKWVRACRGGERPTDGYYVTLWRIMFRYPELLAWETLFNDSVHDTYAGIYERVKAAKPQAQVGWHVWHAASFSPLFRAQTDFRELSKYSDYFKVTVYNNLGGERMQTYISSMRNTVMGDLP